MGVVNRWAWIAGAAGLVLAAPLATAADTQPAAADAAVEAWQGQGQGQGQARSDAARARRAQGNPDQGEARGSQRRGNSGQAEARGNPGRGNAAQGEARGNQNRGRADAASGSPGRSAEARDRTRGETRGRGIARDRVDAAALRAQVERLPEPARRLASSSRRSERLAGLAVASASLRGADAAGFRVDSDGSRVRVMNAEDELLLDLSDQQARELGHWNMRRLGDRQPGEGSPAFCRSGEGHPVFGREWCLEKGFGLGADERNIWSRTRVEDVIFRQEPQRRVTLDRGGLIDVLGDIVFGRLAVHSLALGYDQPLQGRWVHTPDQPEAPWLLRVRAGDAVVAEFVDADRDRDVDVLFVAQPRW